MKVLFDIGHPADFFIFKNVIRKLRERGDETLIVIRNREGVVADLVRDENEEYVFIGENVQGLLKKAVFLFKTDIRLMRIARKFKADVFLSLGSPYSGHVAFLMRKPHITYCDTDISWMVQLLLAPPFSKKVLVPKDSFRKLSFRNYQRVNANKELACLGPRYYSPNRGALTKMGLSENDRFAILRFSAHDSSHDIGLTNLSDESKRKLVREIARYAKPLISTEIEETPELRPYIVPFTKDMHDLLFFASLLVSEGGTMASEGAFLGVPTIFLHKMRFGCIDELKEKGLIRQIENPESQIDEIIEISREILLDGRSKERHQRLKNEIVQGKDDIVEIIIREIDNQALSN